MSADTPQSIGRSSRDGIEAGPEASVGGRQERPDSVADLYPSAVQEATPTALAAYVTLRDAGPLTYGELADALGVSTRAVKGAIYDLVDADVVETLPDPETPSQKLHRITRVESSCETRP
jgi:DNA-binding transcriptional ArsR family regulator